MFLIKSVILLPTLAFEPSYLYMFYIQNIVAKASSKIEHLANGNWNNILIIIVSCDSAITCLVISILISVFYNFVCEMISIISKQLIIVDMKLGLHDFSDSHDFITFAD